MSANNTQEDTSVLPLFDFELSNIIESEYLEPDNIDQLDLKDNDLNILHLNIRSLYSKKDKLETLLEILDTKGYHIDVVAVCETFITEENKNLCDIEGYNFESEYRKTKNGGGIGLYISSELNYIKREDLTVFIEGTLESCFVEIINKQGKNVIVGEVYRVPGTDELVFLENYETFFKKIKTEKKELIIGTDQNLDFLKINSHYNTNRLFDLIVSNACIPVITKPTRITHSTATLIDNIYITENLTTNYKTGIVTYDISDHLPCLVTIKNNSLTKKTTNVEFICRQLQEKNILEFKKELQNIDCNLLDKLNCEEAYNTFTETLHQALNNTCPEK
jgi:exonuclease III